MTAGESCHNVGSTSWTPKRSSRRDKHGASDSGDHLGSRDSNAAGADRLPDRNKSAERSSRSSADRHGSRGSGHDSRRNGAGRNYSRNGFSHRSPNRRSSLDGRAADDRDRHALNGCEKDWRERRGGLEGSRRGRDWDGARAGQARDSAGPQSRTSSGNSELPKASEQQQHHKGPHAAENSTVKMSAACNDDGGLQDVREVHGGSGRETNLVDLGQASMRAAWFEAERVVGSSDKSSIRAPRSNSGERVVGSSDNSSIRATWFDPGEPTSEEPSGRAAWFGSGEPVPGSSGNCRIAGTPNDIQPPDLEKSSARAAWCGSGEPVAGSSGNGRIAGTPIDKQPPDFGNSSGRAVWFSSGVPVTGSSGIGKIAGTPIEKQPPDLGNPSGRAAWFGSGETVAGSWVNCRIAGKANDMQPPDLDKSSVRTAGFNSGQAREGLEMCKVMSTGKQMQQHAVLERGHPPGSALISSNHRHADYDTRCSSSGAGWLYIDQLTGVTQGPVPLSELKRKLSSRELLADHLVSRIGSNEWVTLENAESPPRLHRGNQFSGPEAQALLAPPGGGPSIPSQLIPEMHVNVSSVGAPTGDCDYQINDRVEALMRGFSLTPGKEKETVFAALSSASKRQLADVECFVQESPRFHMGYTEFGDQWKDSECDGDVGTASTAQDLLPVDEQPVRPGSSADRTTEKAPNPPVQAVKEEQTLHQGGQSSIWPSRGGDWKVVVPCNAHTLPSQPEIIGSLEKGIKVVLNEGRALCDIVKSGLPDPRALFPGVSAEGSHSRKLEIPEWAFKVWEKKRLGQKLGSELAAPQLHAAKPKPQVHTPLSERLLELTPVRGSVATPVSGLRSSKPGNTTPKPSSAVVSSKRVVGPDKSNKLSGAPRETVVSGKSEEVAQKAGSPASVDQSVNDHQRKRKVPSALRDDRSRIDSVKRVKLETENAAGKQTIRCRELLQCLESEAQERNRVFATGMVARECLDIQNGDWYFANGSGTECGPFTYASLQEMLKAGTLLEGISIHRKSDDTWISLSSRSVSLAACASGVGRSGELVVSDNDDFVKFHNQFPQFLSFTREKIHEHVMKKYRQVLAGVLTECLDAWLLKPSEPGGAPLAGTSSHAVGLQPMVIAPASSPVTSQCSQLGGQSYTAKGNCSADSPKGLLSDDVRGSNASKQIHANALHADHVGGASVDRSDAKCSKRQETKPVNEENLQQPRRRRFIAEYSDEDDNDTQDAGGKQDCLNGPNVGLSAVQSPSDLHSEGDLLTEEVLLRVFRRLNGDAKDLSSAMTTCKKWKIVAETHEGELTSVNLSPLGHLCTDKVVNALVAVGGGRLKEVILKDCTSITPNSLEDLLRQCPSIALVDISGCTQLKDLPKKVHLRVKWLGCNVDTSLSHNRERVYERTRSLKFKGEKPSSVSQTSEEHSVHSSDYVSGKGKIPDVDVNSMTSTSARIHTLSEQEEPDKRKCLKQANGTRVSGVKKVSRASKSAHHHENGDDLRTHTGHPYEERKMVHRQLPSSASGQKSHKLVSPIKNHDNVRRPALLSLHDGDRSWEKYIRLMVTKVMEADPKKLLNRTVSGDKSGGMDLPTIQKKYKDGLYYGGRGWDMLKEDVRLVIRQGFRDSEGTPKHMAARAVFKAAEAVQREVDESLSAPHKKHSILPENQGRKRKERKGRKRRREEHGKGKPGAYKKIKDEEETESDRSHDRHSKKPAKIGKRRWSESEAESSDDADEEETFADEGEEETETDVSGSEMSSQSEGEDRTADDENECSDFEGNRAAAVTHDWGNRMTKSAMVPPVTRKYEVIDEYCIVADVERVKQKMKVVLPDDYDLKLAAAQEKRGLEYAHLDVPEVKDRQPRKILGQEVVEQEVYGIDPYTHNLLLDTMPEDTEDFAEVQKQQFIEETLLWALNKDVSRFTNTGTAPMEYPLDGIVERLFDEALAGKDRRLADFCGGLLRNIKVRQSKDRPESRDKYVAYRKGLGVVCNKSGGFDKDDFVVEFLGEVYPPWRWYEKQDGIRHIQKKDKDGTPEFYNISLERPKKDGAGYDVLIIDAMHKANFASRLCHSCRPNCEARVTAVDGRYMIGVYTLRPVNCGEELTFDYNSLTESKEEYNSSVCLCGSQGCRGSYLNLAGANTFQEVMRKAHGLLDRQNLLLKACTRPAVTQADMEEMKQVGFGASILSGLPDWVIKFSHSVVQYINKEKTELPDELMKSKARKRRQQMNDAFSEQERVDAEVQTEGLYMFRLQNLAITLDKIRHVLTKLYKDPEVAPPPVKRLTGGELLKKIWKGSNSLVQELLQLVDTYVDRDTYQALRRKIRDHDPGSGLGEVEDNLRHSLLWLRDELLALNASCRARHDAAADVIHLYAYTENFFICEEYEVVESEEIEIDALELGHRHSTGGGTTTWKKVYNREYIWGQLLYWFKQHPRPDVNLSKERRGCLVLPDLASCYAKGQYHEYQWPYGPKQRQEMVKSMEKNPQKQWPKSLWEFKSNRGLYGSPMLDSVMLGRELNREMLHWLRSRPTKFTGPWDQS